MHRSTQPFFSLRLVSTWLFAALTITTFGHFAHAKENAGEASESSFKPAQDYCPEVLAGIDIRPLWTGLKSAASDHHCRKPWVEGKRGELFACGDPATSRDTAGVAAANIAEDNKDWGQALTNWETTGIGGKTTIKGELSTRMIAVGPAFAFNEQTASLYALEPNYDSATALTVCAIDTKGNMTMRGYAGWDGDPDTRPKGDWNFTVETGQNDETDLLALVVDFPDEHQIGRSNESFELRLSNEYTRQDLSIRGIADLHVHQTAELAFGGRLLWGSHTGRMRDALASERFTGDLSESEVVSLSSTGLLNLGDRERISAFYEVFKLVMDSARGGGIPNLDANLMMRLAKSGHDDEGTASTGSRGWPRFEDWPHHADRSHQQVHSVWLRRASLLRANSGQRLALMVSSVVNNDILCNLLSLVDQRGNVPTYGNVGSESANYGCSDYENLNRQIDALHRLEDRNSWYRIALSPWHAREIVHAGDLAVVISMESDKPLSDANALISRVPGSLLDGLGFFEANDGYGTDFIRTLRQYHARGVRSLQPVHESDSIFCGAAVHRSDMDLLQAVHHPNEVNQTLASKGTAFDIERDSYRNVNGLTSFGQRLINEMVKLRMPIDLAHASNQCQLDIIRALPNGYALYNSHTKFDSLLRPTGNQSYYGSHVVARERGFLLTDDMTEVYADRGILVGLRTASVDVYDAATSGAAWDRPVPNNCPGSALSFGQMIKHAYDADLPFAYGTDFNTGVSQLGPRMGNGPYVCYASSSLLQTTHQSTRPTVYGSLSSLTPDADTSTRVAGRNYYTDGLANIAMLPELTWDLQQEIIMGQDSDGPIRGVPGAEELSRGPQKFINMWNGAYAGGRPAALSVASFTAPAREVGEACFYDNQCRSNRCDGKSNRQGQCRCVALTSQQRNLGLDDFCKVGTSCVIRPRLASNFNLLAFMSRDVTPGSFTYVAPTLKNVCR